MTLSSCLTELWLTMLQLLVSPRAIPTLVQVRHKTSIHSTPQIYLTGRICLFSESVAYLPVVQAATTEVRTYTSGSNVAVVDFCVNPFNSGPQDMNMLGFQAFWSSIGTPMPNPAPAPSPSPPPTSTAAVCGKPLILPSATPNIRIVNGVTVPSGGMPWACALVQYGGQFCGCTVIDKQYVLTAGHCVEGSSEALLKTTTKVYLGTTNLLTATAANGNIKGISRVISHPQYDVPEGSTNNDVALIKLDSPIAAWSNTLMPACLPTQPQNASKVATGSKNREIGYVTGWGTLYENQRSGGQIGSGSDNLQQTSIELFSAADCKALLAGYTITDKMLCGGYDAGTYDSCQGDSGGPMVTQSDKGTIELTGVVSWGIGCAEAGKPGIYADVYALSPWITATMAAN
ncbi:hypothetical protein RvY_16469-2 [Ramazzottius varieornatus]|uniref:Peptidase S1 domain-containing protein n=1 Tax=Ramazzottius varieornatus TaxID=947166 RepID=A0A1D1VYJ7_RAMVA|nr:hypothetical protein RvY_16469-1 [Ramazzottius varieornatus]GAV06493.1 hypothetical protein RvY_16469-2 [Ramazzottius varieornatus]